MQPTLDQHQPPPTPATPYGPIKGVPSSVNSGILPIIYKDPLISNNTACCLPNSPPYLSLYNFRVPKPYTAIPTTLPTADSLDRKTPLSQRRTNKGQQGEQGQQGQQGPTRQTHTKRGGFVIIHIKLHMLQLSTHVYGHTGKTYSFFSNYYYVCRYVRMCINCS